MCPIFLSCFLGWLTWNSHFHFTELMREVAVNRVMWGTPQYPSWSPTLYSSMVVCYLLLQVRHLTSSKLHLRYGFSIWNHKMLGEQGKQNTCKRVANKNFLKLFLKSRKVSNKWGVPQVGSMASRCGGYHYCIFSLNKSWIQGSMQVQILLVLCKKFVILRISDNGPSWK